MRGFHGEPPRMPLPPRAAPTEARVETLQVDDLLEPPRRFSRPDHIVVIIRGPPGAGKTYVSKLLKVVNFHLSWRYIYLYFNNLVAVAQ